MSDSIDPMSNDDFKSWFDAVVEQDQRLVGITRVWKTDAIITDPHAPTCGRCQIKMIIKSNHTTGDKFYGCPNYARTKCRSIPLKATSYGRAGSSVWNSWIPSEEDYDIFHGDIGDRL